MCLPCNLNDETHFEAGCRVCTAESIDNIELLVGKLLDSKLLESFPSLRGNWLVVILVLLRSPPYSVLAGFVHYKEFVFRRTAGVNASHYVHSSELSKGSFVETFKCRVEFVVVQSVVVRVVNYLCGTSDAVLGQIDFAHIKIIN